MKNDWRRRDALLAFLCMDLLISAGNAADTVAFLLGVADTVAFLLGVADTVAFLFGVADTVAAGWMPWNGHYWSGVQ